MYDHIGSVKKPKKKPETPVPKQFHLEDHSYINMRFSVIQWLGTKQTQEPRLSTQQKNWNLFGMCQLLTKLASNINFLHLLVSEIQPDQTFSHCPSANLDAIDENNTCTALKTLWDEKQLSNHTNKQL